MVRTGWFAPDGSHRNGANARLEAAMLDKTIKRPLEHPLNKFTAETTGTTF